MAGQINVHLDGVPYTERFTALAIAEHFAMQYPDKVGQYNGCAYAPKDTTSFYAWRTKGGRIVVRANP